MKEKVEVVQAEIIDTETGDEVFIQQHTPMKSGMTLGVVMAVSMFAGILFGAEISQGPPPAVIETETESEAVTEAQTEKVVIETEEQIFVSSVFDSGESVGLGKHIAVAGLNDTEKSLLNFQESSFVTSLSQFLEKEHINAKKITFLNRVQSSTDAGVCYLAELEKVSDHQILIWCFPDVQGRYLYALTDVPKREAVQTQTEAPVRETEAAQQVREQHRTPETERAYDATRLSVKNISSELGNYIDNETELQYELYHHLFQSENGSVTYASVTGYEINPDVRTATVTFGLSNGHTVTGIYHRDSGNWTFN